VGGAKRKRDEVAEKLAELASELASDPGTDRLRATLVDKYDDPNPIKDRNKGWTELHHLARYTEKPGKVIALLQRDGVDPSVPARFENKGNHTTPLHLAAHRGN